MRRVCFMAFVVLAGLVVERGLPGAPPPARGPRQTMRSTYDRSTDAVAPFRRGFDELRPNVGARGRINATGDESRSDEMVPALQPRPFGNW